MAKDISTPEEWEKAVLRSRDFDFLRDIPMRENRLEGFLYPDTYRIRRDTTIDQMIDMMLKRFAQVWNQEFADLAREKGMSVYQVVTVAAMIEKEALFDSERPRIAGVIYNRLQDGMPLQVDATVLYSLGRHKDQVLLKDLRSIPLITPTATPDCRQDRSPHLAWPAYQQLCSRKTTTIYTM